MIDPQSQPANAAGGDSHHQLTALALTGLLWSWWPAPTIVALILAYFAALLLINSSFVLWGQAFTLNRLPRRWAIAVTLLALSAPAAILLRDSPRLVWYEQLTALQANLPDRLSLEEMPAIFPRVLRTNQPQRFYIHASGAREVQANWEGLHKPLTCLSLGHGLFQLDYEPALHGTAISDSDHVDVNLTLDRRTVTRRLRSHVAQPHPRWFASNPQFGQAATVSEETDQLIVVDRHGSHQIFQVGDGPTDCVWLGESQLVVCHRHSRELSLVDVAVKRQSRLADVSGRWTRMAVSPDGQVLAAGRAGALPQIVLLSVAELLTNQSPTPIVVDLPDEPDWISFGRNSGLLIVSCRKSKSVYRIVNNDPVHREAAGANETSANETGANEAVANEALPRSGGSQRQPWTLDPEPLQFPRPISAMGRTNDGATLYLATTSDVSGAGDLQGNHLIANSIHLLDSRRWQIRQTIRTDRRSERQDLPGNADRGGSPMGFCATEDDRMRVAMAGTNEVWELSATGDERLEVVDLRVPGMSAPHGVGYLGEGRWCVSSPTDAAIEVFEADGQPVARIGLVTRELSETELWRRRGERTFYESTRSGVSCQSRHLHADSDYSRHNIGQGHLSATLSAAGISGTAPYLRDASNSRLRDLHDLAAGHYRGYRREVPWDRARALAAYLDDLPSAAPLTKSGDVDRRRRGVDAFVKADCVACHAFPAFTNLSLHYAAFLFPEHAQQWRSDAPRVHLLDTPSLIGLSHSAPYLHDGRASTLEQVLHEQNPDNRHGNVRSLTPEELEDLAFFLKSL